MKKKVFAIGAFLTASALLFSQFLFADHPQEDDIYIVFTNDVSSEISGEIGYAGVKAFRDELLSEHPYVTLVDAGDFFDGEIGHIDGGKYIVQLMNAVGYEVVTLGNQEFSIGIESLAEAIKESDFEYVSCNLRHLGSGKNLLKNVKPYVIKKFGWTKVAFIGVTTPETLRPGKRAYEELLKDGELQFDFYQEDEGQELYEQVQKTVDKVRKKVDYVVVLAHLGQNNVTSGFSSFDLIRNTEGIDVVIDAHSHTPNTGEAVENKNGEVVVLTSTGEKINYIGLLMMHTDHTYTTVLYPSYDKSDPEIEQLAETIHQNTGY